jgi:AP2 domain
MPKKRSVKRHPVAQPLDQSYRLIPLTQGQNAIVDAEDFEPLSQRNWWAIWCESTESFYAYGWKDGLHVAMHNELLHCSTGEQADHKDHNTLNNRKYNLRKCTHAENCKNQRRPSTNTSGFKGAFWQKDMKRSGGGRWASYITFNGKRTFLGHFNSAKEAAHAYDEAAKLYHGEFAHLNFQE